MANAKANLNLRAASSRAMINTMSDTHNPLAEEDDEDPGWGLGWAYWAIWILATTLAWNLSSLVRGAIFEASGSSLSQIVNGVSVGIALGFAQ